MANEDQRVDHLLEVYDRLLKIYQIVNDNYFKRTQIVMVAIQIALFTAFAKFASDSIKDSYLPSSALLMIVATLGIILALTWFLL